MEKPPIVEKISDKIETIKRRIGAFIFAELERFDDALDVYGSDDFPVDEERLATEEELEELESHIIRGEE